jgi:hypothetical protein
MTHSVCASRLPSSTLKMLLAACMAACAVHELIRADMFAVQRRGATAGISRSGAACVQSYMYAPFLPDGCNATAHEYQRLADASAHACEQDGQTCFARTAVWPCCTACENSCSASAFRFVCVTTLRSPITASKLCIGMVSHQCGATYMALHCSMQCGACQADRTASNSRRQLAWRASILI